MPKMKSKSAAKKRFTITPSGKIKRSKMGKNHILTKKSTKRKRGLRQGGYVDHSQEKSVRTLIQ